MSAALKYPVPPGPPPQPKEQRRHPRHELLASVQILQGDEMIILPALNLSLGGVLLGADHHDLSRFSAGTQLDVLLFDALDSARPSVTVHAKVVRKSAEAIALTWMPGNPGRLHDLANLIDSLKPRRP